MKQILTRFDMKRPPIRTRWFLRPLTWLLSAPDVMAHHAKIRKINTDGLRPPYVLLCNHNAFLDFKVATIATFPHRANYVVAIDGFIGREELLRQVGCICKRKFTNDTVLVRQLRQVIQNGDIAMIYPEARYSLCGTTAVLPASLGKLCKLLKAPVVTLICHGHHVNSPFWNLHSRGVRPTEAELTQIFTAEELERATVEEVNAKILEMFRYDDFAWQKQRGIRTPYEKRAEGLHKVLYQCPHCGTEYRMASEGTQIICQNCGKHWHMTEYGELKALDGETEFSHIPDWYEWERANVRAEVETGTYSSGVLQVHVDSLPNAKRFIRLGEGTMIHDIDGFTQHSRGYASVRCMIPGKRKAFIKCPDTVSCATCPYKDKKQAPIISWDGLVETGYEPVGSAPVDEQVMAKLEYESIKAMMDAEDTRIAKAFEMKTLQGYTIREIAAELKISEPRVYQLIARAKAIGKEYRKNNG